MSRTLRSVKLRNLLYASTGGKCAICACELPVGWHADHVVPWSRTQRTNVHGMQPLCPSCNLRKGTKMSADSARTPRPFQTEMRAEVARLVRAREKLLIAHVHPGSGKTEGEFYAAEDLEAAGVIEQVAIFVPRLNLAIQAEKDWEKFRHRRGKPHLGRIAQRDNTLPLLRRGKDGLMAFGYVTTYQSLIANPQVHYDFATSGKTLIIFDEGQQLGADEASGGAGTRSGKIGIQLAGLAAFTVLQSGTPDRPDGLQLILAPYAEPDEHGFRRLLAHVEADYLTGVKNGYLREFEGILHDGRGFWKEGAKDPALMVLSEMEKQVGRILRQNGYWEPLVDKFVAKLRAVRGEVHPELTGLIAAADQQQAREIIAYLRRTCPEYRVVLAVSDELKARDNLDSFRDGVGDILVTVAMAHVGFDCPTISVIAPLTTARTDGWLRQLFARGLRVWYGPCKKGKVPPPQAQVCHIIAPDDILMAKMVERMRRESVAGILEREKKTGPGDGGGDPTFGEGYGAELLGDRVQGLNPDGDADHAFLERIRPLIAKHGIPLSTPESKLAALVREFGMGAFAAGAAQEPPAPESPPMRPETKTEIQEERALRRACQKLAGKIDHLMMRHDSTWKHGYANASAKQWFGTALGSVGVYDLPDRLRWMENDLKERQAYFGEPS